MSEGLGGLLTRAIATPDEDAGDADALRERILDAALTQVAAVGVRRTTMDDVARRAGVGRVTVFRRFGGKEALLEALAVREARRFFAEIDAATRGLDDPVERTVASFVTGLRLSRGHPLLDRLARIEPDTVLATLAQGRPPLMALARDYVARPLRAAVRDERIHIDDCDRTAEILLRLAVSFLLLPDSVVDLGDEAAVRALAGSVIDPMLRNPPA